MNANDLFSGDFVSVAFFSLGILERLGIDHSNARVFPAADGKLRKCGRQFSVVQKNADFLIQRQSPPARREIPQLSLTRRT